MISEKSGRCLMLKNDQRMLIALAPITRPVTGRREVSVKLLSRLQGAYSREKGAVSVDYSPRLPGWKGMGIKGIACLKFLMSVCKSKISGADIDVYIALNDRRGLIFDFFVIFVSKPFVSKFVLHHHSRAYVEKTAWMMSNIVRVASGAAALHVFQCNRLSESFIRRYRCPWLQVESLNNSFAVDHEEESRNIDGVGVSEGGRLRVGYLSKLCREKGVGEFLAVADRFSHDIDFEFSIVGSGGNEFHEDIQRAENIEFVGALYGEDKYSWYRSIDIFLFPTWYDAETEGLVVLEALSSGCVVMVGHVPCCDRGSLGAGVLRKHEVRDGWVDWAETQIRDCLRQGLGRESSVRCFEQMRKMSYEALQRVFRHYDRSDG